MSFDWKTDDAKWDDDDEPLPSAPARKSPAARVPTSATPIPFRRLSRRARLAVFGLLALALLAGLGAALYRQLDRRAEAAIEGVKTQVLASQAIIERAAVSADRELLTPFLSGRDDGWATAQERLVSEGLYLERPALGLDWQGPAGEPAVEVAPDLRSAVLTVPQAYVIEAGNGLTETVTLQQTAVFRPAADRWLLAPPDDGFWGESRLQNGRYLSFTYPARDAALVERLAGELDAKMAQLCERVAEANCPDGPLLQVDFSTDPSSLIQNELLPPAYQLALPAPTLAGLPADEIAYRALYRAFAARVVATVTPNLVGWSCCVHTVYFRALQEALLGQLDLRPAVTPERYAELARDPSAFERLERLWADEAQPDPSGEVEVLVDFLARAVGKVPVMAMMRELTHTADLGFDAWLARATDRRYQTPGELERALLGYALSQAGPPAPLAPPPEQDLALICRPSGGAKPALYRYDVAAGQAEVVRNLGTAEAPALVALPDDSGVIIAERADRFTGRDTTIYRDGLETRLDFNGVASGDSPLVPVAEDAGKILFYLDSNTSVTLYGLLVPELCQGQASCNVTAAGGNLTWSPDGTNAILAVGGPDPLSADRRTPLLFLTDTMGESGKLLEKGASPFWIDDQTYGYVTDYAAGEGQSVVIRRADPATGELSDGESTRDEVILRSGDLVPFVPNTGGPVFIDRVLPDPADPERLFVVISQPMDTATFSRVMLLDMRRQEVSPRFGLTPEPALTQRGYGVSPDRRWLVITSLSDEVRADGSLVWNVLLHDMQANTTQLIPIEADPTWPGPYLIDWVSDGRWLSVLTNGYVLLVNPGARFQTPVIIPDAACTSAAWVD